MTVEEIAFANYRSRTAFDQEIRDQDPRFANMDVDDGLVAGRLSQWLQAQGIVPDGVKPNHGRRHRFKTVGREAEISDRVLDAIQGHVARTAGDDVTIVTKKKAIDRLPSFPMQSRRLAPSSRRDGLSDARGAFCDWLGHYDHHDWNPFEGFANTLRRARTKATLPQAR